MSWHAFVRHLVEMIVAILLGMAVFGAAASLVFALIGHSNPCTTPDCGDS